MAELGNRFTELRLKLGEELLPFLTKTVIPELIEFTKILNEAFGSTAMDTSGIDELSKKYLDFVQSLSGAEKDAAQAQYDRWQKKLDWYKKDLEAAEAAQKSAETGGGLGSFINWFTGDAWTKFVNWTGQYQKKRRKQARL